MLIDDFLPTFDVNERHSVQVNAPVENVYLAVRHLDLSHAGISRVLFRLRGIRASASSNLDDFLRMGFILLGEKPNEELLLGLVGRFWTPSGGLRKMDADAFRRFDERGFARAVWNFSLTDHHGSIALQTETRVLCTDEESRRQFRRYWRIVGVFSGLIRKDILRSIKKKAEQLR
jgi:hypothetical protein